MGEFVSLHSTRSLLDGLTPLFCKQKRKRPRTTAKAVFDFYRDSKKAHTRMGMCFFGETFDWMSELFAIYSISSVVGMFIGLSSKVRISLI